MAATALFTNFFPIGMPVGGHCSDQADLDTFVDFGTPSPPRQPLQQFVGDNKLFYRPSLPSFDGVEQVPLALDSLEDLQTPAIPSHEYGLYKQQTGISLRAVSLSQSVQSAPATVMSDFASRLPALDGSQFLSPTNAFASLESLSPMAGPSSAGDLALDMDMDFSSDPISVFLHSQALQGRSKDAVVDPAALLIDPTDLGSTQQTPPVRLWPGMHQQQAQQAARAKAQEQQQLQEKIVRLRQQQQEQQHQRKLSAQLPVSPNTFQTLPMQSQPMQSTVSPTAGQLGPRGSRSSIGQNTDPSTEATISRVVNQVVRAQNSVGSAGHDGSSGSGSMSHLLRSKKDEDDMDEDERLLASEAGKKLSSKERRQLRNKVSARAFRSRRKGTL